jgi:integrase/recombinase XerD
MLNEKTIKTNEFKKAHAEYERMVITKGYKTGNGQMYQKTVKEFLIWIETKNLYLFTHITSEVCLEYYDYLVNRVNKRRGGGLSNTTINHHLFGLRLFIEQLFNTEKIIHAVAIPPNLKYVKTKDDNLTLDQIQQLYNCCENTFHKALLSLSYGAGLRRKELVDLCLRDFDFQRKIIIVRAGKGNKTREIPMSDVVHTHVRDYLDQDRLNFLNNDYSLFPNFFITRRGIPSSGDYLNRELKYIVKQTRNSQILNKDISLHSMRHCIATHLVENGAGMEFIRDFLGHETIDTSSLYMIRRKRKNTFSI